MNSNAHASFGEVNQPRYFGKEPADVFARRMMEQDPFCEIRENLMDSDSDDFQVECTSSDGNSLSLKQQSKRFHKSMFLH